MKSIELYTLVISIRYASIEEVHQYFVPFRSLLLNDFKKNSIKNYLS
ncbi:VanZ family protein [Bacillus spongiae]